MMLRNTLRFAVLVCVLTLPRFGAAEDEREFAFEVSTEPLDMKLFRADPKLLEQRFVAHVDVLIPGRFIRQRRGNTDVSGYVSEQLMEVSEIFSRLYELRDGKEVIYPIQWIE